MKETSIVDEARKVVRGECLIAAGGDRQAIAARAGANESDPTARDFGLVATYLVQAGEVRVSFA